MKKIVFAISLVFTALMGVGQDTVYHYFIGTTGTETATAIFENDDYVDAFGSTGGAGSGQSDIYCIRMNSEFQLVNFVTIGGLGIESLKAVDTLTGQKGYAILYQTYDGFGTKGYFSKLQILDSNLVPGLAAEIFGESDYYPVDLKVADGSYYALTRIQSSEYHSYKVSVFDASLELSHDFNIDYTDSISLKSIFIDDGILLVGTIKELDSTHSDVLLLKYDNNGSLIEELRYGTEFDDIGESVSLFSDTAYLITGSTRGFSGEDYDMYLVKIDTSFSVEWAKIHGNNPFTLNKDELGKCSLLGFDDKIYAAMTTQTYGQGGQDFMVYILTNQGEFEVGFSYGLEDNETLVNFTQFRDSSFTLIGVSESSLASGVNDIFIVHLDRFVGGAPEEYINIYDTNTIQQTVVIQTLSASQTLVKVVYSEQTSLVKSNTSISVKGDVFNMEGAVVSHVDLSNRNSWSDSLLEAGMYFAVLEAEDGRIQRVKFMIGN